MARIPDAFIDDLLARTDIVEVVGTRVPLKRQGKEYSARCPFHDERSPSFTVSPTKQFYHCFGCGAHGTAISFLMNYDRLEFLDAVDELAKRVGMEVPKDTQARNETATAATCTRRWTRPRSSSSASSTRATRRGPISTSAASTTASASVQHRLCARWLQRVEDALGTDQRRMKLLERAGMLSQNDNGRVYDKFRDRVMFPIHDRRGRVIAFGGRVLDRRMRRSTSTRRRRRCSTRAASCTACGRCGRRNAKIERLIVVEGYMDVVALFQYGVTQAVATLGTATTPDHAELLFRNAPDVYFCFDGDRAGRGAAWKAVESVLPRMKDGRQAFFLFLPDGEDPDTHRAQRRRATASTRACATRRRCREFFFAELSQGREPRRRWKARRGSPNARSRCSRRFPTARSAT